VNLADLIRHPAEWRRGNGPMNDIVFSSRVRLARNLAGMPFLSRCSRSQVAEIAETIRQTLMKLALGGETLYVDMGSADPLDREVLVERHLVSRQLVEASGPRGVAIAGDETVSVMINEEDHLRAQVLRGGLQLDACYAEINRLDEQLEGRLDFAFSSRCPTNVGTALRLSVMMHLPALKLTGQIEKALRAARDMRLAVRGLYGEGTEAVGDLFQVSNQITLGRSEEQIIAEFRDEIVPALIDYERRARQALVENRRLALEDKVGRALAVLRAARLISSEETLYLLSHVRLGVALGMVSDVTAEQINDLALITQPAHLQKLTGKALSPPERGQVRASMIQERLGSAERT
jgi:protein arginine kinase